MIPFKTNFKYIPKSNSNLDASICRLLLNALGIRTKVILDCNSINFFFYYF